MSKFSVARSRAAVICLGGWGLQTMLHLWPRIRFIQEERRALGLEDELPNLNELTAFAAVVPQPVIPLKKEELAEYTPFQVLRRGVPPASFYVEQWLLDIANQLAESETPLRRTYAERLAALLMTDAIKKNHVAGLPVKAPGLGEHWLPGHRLTRVEGYTQAIRRSEAIAQALLREVINPTRRDRVQFRDPVVQTSIYVVASLSEPLVSCLIWPMLSELAAQMKGPHIARITALFATSSFAADDTGPVEQACAHMAIRELENLTGLRTDGLADMRSLVQRIEGEHYAGWSKRIGQRLFHEIYLVDTEKISNSIAENGQELAILASNAIEAFLVADGALHIEKHLGSHLEESIKSPYSALGAANDYIPLPDYVSAAIQEEQRRIVRESVLLGAEGLASPDEELASPVTQNGSNTKSVAELGASVKHAMRSLIRPGAERMFDRVYRSDQTSWFPLTTTASLLPDDDVVAADSCAELSQDIPSLRMSMKHILPPALVQGLKQDWQWLKVVDKQVEVTNEKLKVDLTTKHFERSWGLASERQSTQQPDEAETKLFREKTWAERKESDTRTIPAVVWKALRETIRTICSDASGLLAAQAQLRAWTDEVENLVTCLRPRWSEEEDQERVDEQYNERKAKWRRRFIAVAGNIPFLSAATFRALPFALFMTFVFYSLVLYTWNLRPSVWQTILLAGLCFAATIGLILLPYSVNRALMAWVRRQYLRLVQEYLSAKANLMVRFSLHKVFRSLLDELKCLMRPLDSAIDELKEFSVSKEPIRVPPDNITKSQLRVPHTNEAIWQSVKDLISQQQTGRQTSQQSFVGAWKRAGKDMRLWQEQKPGDKLAQRVRLALEVDLNESDRARVFGKGSSAPTGSQDCPFHTEPSEAKKPEGCTACSHPKEPCRYDLVSRGAKSSLDGLIHDHVADATRSLQPEKQVIPGSAESVRKMIDAFAFERVLFEGVDRDEGEQRAFVEDLYARAKVAVNYEMKSQLDREPIKLEFGVTTDASQTVLHPQFKQRGMPVLSSYDPIAVSAVRTEHGLRLQDLAAYERCSNDHWRLHKYDRSCLEVPGSSELYWPSDIAIEADQVPLGPVFTDCGRG